MKWYLAKVVYQIICGDGRHTPQFEEQLRLIEAEDEFQAFQKARLMGEREEDNFMNENHKPVLWKFVDIPEIHFLSNLSDGVEVYSQIREEESALSFINGIQKRAHALFEKSLEKLSL